MVNKYVRLTLACTLAVLTAISAQIVVKIGPIPYTMQNFAVILSGLVLGKYGALAQLIYLAMIALGIPAGAGYKGGLGVLFGYTAGYLWMFPISAFIMGLIREKVYRTGSSKELFLLWLGSLVAVTPMYLAGFAVFYEFASGNSGLLNWCISIASKLGFNFSGFWAVFFATVLVFVPQDLFMDHVLALIVFKYVHSLLREKGYDLP